MYSISNFIKEKIVSKKFLEKISTVLSLKNHQVTQCIMHKSFYSTRVVENSNIKYYNSIRPKKSLGEIRSLHAIYILYYLCILYSI
jgi:hypothetical protein